MPVPRFFQRKPTEEKRQNVSQHSAKEWRNAGIVLAVLIIGVIISFSFLPGYLPGVDVWVIFIVFCGIVSTLACVADDALHRKSYSALFWQLGGLLALAIVGAFVSSALLARTMPLYSRALLGALIGLAAPGPMIYAYREGMAQQQKH